MTDIILESPRISSTDTVIYTDRIPKNMYEYFLNGYKETDIRKLIDNTQMEFETWDKTCNMYKSSNALMELSDGTIAILFEDVLGNQFIYSSAKNKVFFYKPNEEPYIDINKGLTIEQFLTIARDDFNALMRTAYGKKYVTEACILTEGIKQVLGYGHAYRIFIDSRNYKNSTRYAIDKDTYAVVDALDDYKEDIIDKTEFGKIINHPNTIVEIYDNHKLGKRDALRRMKVVPDALIEKRTTSLLQLMNDEGMNPGLDYIYRDYIRAKSYKLMVKNAKPKLEAYLKKTPLMKAAYAEKYDDLDDFLTLEQMYNLPLLAISEYSNGSYVATFDLAKYKRAYMASINNRFQKFNNSDVVDKFLSHIDYLIKMFKSCDPHKIWYFYATMHPLTEEEVRNNCKGLCAIRATTYPADEDIEFATPPPNDTAKQYLNNITQQLYEYMTGYPFDALETDALRYKLDKELGNTARPIHEKKEFSDKDIEDMIQSHIDAQMMDELLTEEALEATMYYVALERDLGRKIAHNVRAGAEAIGKAADRTKRVVSNVVGPIMDKTKALLNEVQKQQEEDTREEIITDSTFVKLRNFFKQTALPAVALHFALGPALAIVGFLTIRALKTDDKKIRNSVERELETELKLTREKIEDARRKDDDKAKYELMRLESKIEDNLAKIKYGHD